MIFDGYADREVARDLGVNDGTLGNWVMRSVCSIVLVIVARL
jgi:transposase-like protein